MLSPSWLALGGLSAAWAASGDTRSFVSPLGRTEVCVRATHIPGGVYSAADLAEEQRLCDLDLHGDAVALCPKTWSTSPGTMVYATGGLAPATYETSACGRNAHDTLAVFKTTMNAKDTSATFSTASLLYYHFSRYLEAEVEVPVAVYRTMDREAHLARVSARATGTGLNANAWRLMRTAEQTPEAYQPVAELFTDDRTRIHGVLLRHDAPRYGPELNGTRAGGEGDGQSLDFQRTPAFLALSADLPLRQAISRGLAAAGKDPVVRASLGSGAAAVTHAQVVHWMRDLTEITLLDFIFSQQDRVGNIDYRWAWTWTEDGAVRSVDVGPAEARLPRSQAHSLLPPADLATRNPVLLQRTVLGDNDAAGRFEYRNYTKRTGMLEAMRHYPALTYWKLLALDADFAQAGPLYRYTRDTFGLSAKQLDAAVKNTRLARQILATACERGRLRFDLEPEQVLTAGPDAGEVAGPVAGPAAAPVDCLRP